MLRELHISNFAIIEKQSIRFGDGLNVLSGETGSGKSVVLQAFELILGGRPKPKYIRTGTDGWEIEALFDLSTLPTEVREELPDMCEGEELVVSRSMSAGGRGRVLINGRLGTVSLLSEICSRLMNICAQGQHIKLLDPKFHLELLDGFAAHHELLGSYRSIYESWKALSKELEESEERVKQNLLRRAELEYVVEELTPIEPRDGMRNELEGSISRMANSERLLERARGVTQMLNEEQGILALVSRLVLELDSVSALDPTAASHRESLQNIQLELEGFEGDLSRYFQSIHVEEEDLARLRDDLAEVARLERKYRTDSAGLANLLEQAQSELSLLDNQLRLEELREEVARELKRLRGMAKKLSDSRKKALKRLVATVSSELQELSMAGAKLSAEFEAKDPSSDGCDRLEFRIAPNKGETARPLREIASGGELSRIMLVLKKVLRDSSGVNVLVFDEVDTGISGGVARAVGMKLRELAQNSQVVCITHLAQVASLADRHFLVDKESKERTVSRVRELSEEEKVEEIARMLAGYEVTEASRESARELLTSKA